VFIHFITELAKNFPCSECQDHFIQYLEADPPALAGIGHHGVFYWSVDLHNHVNKRIGKPTLTPEKALALYDGPAVCQSCGSPGKPDTVVAEALPLVLQQHLAQKSVPTVITVTAVPVALQQYLEQRSTAIGQGYF
jgi:hypothetical protein